MKLLLRLLGFVIISSAFPAFAAEKIEAAFGKKLGAVFDPGNLSPEDPNPVAPPNYRFQPEKGFATFTGYFVGVTPKTHRIFSITASGPVSDAPDLRQKFALLEVVLRDKYGEETPPTRPIAGMRVPGENTLSIRQAGRVISLTADQTISGQVIQVSYFDDTIYAQAQREIEELAQGKRAAETALLKAEAAKLDTSGL